MTLKIVKPTSPGRRTMTIADFSGLSKGQPEKRLTRGKKRISGRASSGSITVRRRGGGHKRLYRHVDFLQSDKQGVPAKVIALEYDPNRSARIALLHYSDGEKRYMLAPEGLKVGDEVVCAERTKVKLGNRMKLKHIPSGYRIFNVETLIGHGGSTVRSAGTAATLVGGDGEYGIVEMPSGEVRRVHSECYATIGIVSNPEHSLISTGKAGRKRWLGRRPKVLGKSMNAVDHPHGGGEGHSPIGHKYPKTPQGKHALGVYTRTPHKYSDRLVVRSRAERKRSR